MNDTFGRCAWSRWMNVPVVSKAPEEARDHFGFLGHFVGRDVPTSSKRTRELLGWQPRLIPDLDRPRYFESWPEAAKKFWANFIHPPLASFRMLALLLREPDAHRVFGRAAVLGWSRVVARLGDEPEARATTEGAR